MSNLLARPDTTWSTRGIDILRRKYCEVSSEGGFDLFVYLEQILGLLSQTFTFFASSKALSYHFL